MQTDEAMETEEAMARADRAAAAMEADGVSSSVPAQVDYFDTDETYQVFLPDGVSFLECKVLTEGDRLRYQQALTKDLRIQKGSGDAFMKMKAGEERTTLLRSAIVGWNLVSGGKPVPFGKGEERGGRTQSGYEGSTLAQFLSKARPQVIDHIEREIRKHEPWVVADLSVEEIDRQIEELTELRKELAEREEGKAG